MVAGAEAVLARLWERKEGVEGVVEMKWTDRKSTIFACSQRVWIDKGGGTELQSRYSIEDCLQPVPNRGENGSSPAWGGIGEARNQCGSEYYGKLEGGRSKVFSLLRKFVACAARCTEGIT